MRHLRVTFFFLAVVLALSSCSGGSEGTDVAIAATVEAQPTVNSVQAVPAQEPEGSTTDEGQSGAASDGATAALPTAVTLPTAAPTPEPTVDRSQPTTYIVQSGDVLGLIAERFDADIAELRRVNDLDGNLIRVGQELTIPALDGSTTTGTTTESAADASADPAPAPSSPSTASVSCSSTGTGHCVQPGESLLGIALKYDVTVESLRTANPGIVGDLIKSGEVINLSGGGSASPAPAAPAPSNPAPAATAGPVATVGPTNDADCKARNFEFPFFHASDGLCYANPIGATVVPTSAGASGNTTDGDVTCDPGFFLWEDGLCYPIPGATVVATAGPSPTSPPVSAIYGRPPCRDGYVEIVASNVCWPEPNTTPTTPVPTTTATAQECVAPNFVLSGSTCFVTSPEGSAAGCTVTDGKPSCPST